MNSIDSQSFGQLMPSQVINSDQQIFNRISETGSSKEKLEKVSKEFEAVFITKMLSLMDKTVDKEGGIFGEESSYCDKMKSFMFTEMGRQMANNPRTTFGFAKQIYEQMEKHVK